MDWYVVASPRRKTLLIQAPADGMAAVFSGYPAEGIRVWRYAEAPREYRLRALDNWRPSAA